jgi:cytochrome P450
MNQSIAPAKQKPPPGPKGRALLDDLKAMQENPLRLITSSFQRYGDFIHYPLGFMQVYIISHPDAVQHILQLNHRNYSKKTFQYNLLAGITGRGLLTNDGESWLQQRRLIQPAFHRSKIAAFDSLIVSSALRVLDRWERAGEEILDIDAEMMQLTLQIVGQALFSIDLSDQANELTQATLIVLDYIVHRARHPISLPPGFPTTRNRQFSSALRLFNRYIQNLIEGRRRDLDQSNGASRAGSPDLLEMLLLARDEQTGKGMDDRQLRDEIITLLIAGHETVASALTWTWYLLSQNPQQESELHAELDQVLQGRFPSSPDLARLPYTRMVFEEGLRIYPPAWMITRRATGLDRLPGYEEYPIPAGALVLTSPYLVHRHPDFWGDPEKFMPERFSPENSAKRPRFTYIPFGGGPRLCIGDGFAMLEARLLIAAIAQRYRLRPIGSKSVEAASLVTLRPINGLPMAIEPR